MKLRTLFFVLLVSMMATTVFVSCSDDDDDDDNSTETFLKSPYLICVSRNPGGVGFDFEYNGGKGGANNLDSLTATGFTHDMFIKTVKGEKADGSLGGAPYFKLSSGTLGAVNYSAVDASCKGIDAFNSLTASNIKAYTLKKDSINFDLTSLPTGSKGKPLMSALKKEYKKLVIGMKWRETANNDVENDELVWIIKTREKRLVKLIVTDFPASPAPTATGYIAITWDFLN